MGQYKVECLSTASFFQASLIFASKWCHTLGMLLLIRKYQTSLEKLAMDQGILKGKYHYTIHLLFDWFGISSLNTDNLCIYLQNRLIPTSQTGGQWYRDTSPFSIPSMNLPLPYFVEPIRKSFIILTRVINHRSKFDNV